MAIGSRPTARSRLVAFVLLALALRALIPIGFMPAGDGSFSLMICPGGLPAGLLQGRSMGQDKGQDMGRHGMAPAVPMTAGMRMPAQEHRGTGGLDDGYCAFTTGFSSAPPPLLLASLFLLLACAAIIAVPLMPPSGIRLVHLPPARAPPAPF